MQRGDDEAAPQEAAARRLSTKGAPGVQLKNKEALRVLLSTRKKLDGVVGSTTLGIAGHVNYLIQVRMQLEMRPGLRISYILQEATSVDNLARLFEGWQPWV